MIRVGLAGCGAVSRLYYGPALALLEREGRLTLAGVFDPDPKAAAQFPSAQPCADFEALLELGLNLVIIASPPRFHAPQAIAALQSGVAVHCEKPLALSAREAEGMVAAARAARAALSVGLMRRSFPAVRAIAGMLQHQTIGALRSVDVFEGGAFDWPVSSPGYFSQAESGGGVLRDLGPHALDLLIGWLGHPLLGRYEDDAGGGVEANCRVELTCGAVPCAVRLSRDWPRPNRYLFTGEQGWISWVPYEAERLEIALNGGPAGVLNLHQPDPRQPFALEPPEADFHGAFASSLRGVVAKLGAWFEPTPRTLGLDALALIDLCYERRRPMDEPWRLPAAPAPSRARAKA